MALSDTIADLEGEELSADQYRKLQEIKRLAVEKGYLKSINPAAQPNRRNETIQQAPESGRTFADHATDFITKDVPEIGAATAGSMLGAQRAAGLPLPGILRPIGVAAGGALGAVSGLMAMRGGRQIAEQGRPLSLDQLLGEAKRSGIEGATGEALGQVPRLLGGAYRAGKRSLLAGRAATPDELKIFDDAAEIGVHLRPADVTKAPAALRAEQTLRGTQAGSGMFSKTDLLNQKNFERAYREQITDVVASRATPEERGKLIQDVIERKAIPEYQEMARRRFDELRQVTGGEEVVLPRESFELLKELEHSITAQATPRAAAILKRVREQISKPGMQTGVSVSKEMGTVPGLPYMAGMKVKSTSTVPGEMPTTGLQVKARRGEISAEDQAIEDLGGKPAEAPLLGLKIKKTSEGTEVPITTGLKVAPRMETTPDTKQLAKLTVETTSRLPDKARPLDFMQAHDVRSLLGEFGATGETLPKKAQGIANRLWEVLGHEMELGALKFKEKTGVPVDHLWRKADAFVKEQGHELFGANVITQALKATPEDVVTATFKPGGITEVKRIMQALKTTDDTTALEQWQRGVLERLWEEGVVKTGARRGEFSGTAFADAVAKYGEPTVKEALGDSFPRFQKFLRIAADMDPKSASGYGVSLVDKGIVVTAPLFGIGGSFLHGTMMPMVAATATAGTWLIGTHHLSKILNDPKRAGALLRVVRSEPGTEVWSRAVGQVLGVEMGEAVMPQRIDHGQLQPAP